MRKAFKILAVTTLVLTLALPFTAYASQWTQDAMGWKVRQDDGTYLTSQWYQSPESGLYYYMGADGYMLVNAITPDGFQVGADGAWIQPTQKAEPKVQPTQSSSDDSMISEEEANRIIQEVGIGNIGEGKVETINSAEGWGGDTDAADFNWHQ